MTLDSRRWRSAIVDFSVKENPRESLNWRRHRQGCPHYRERWFAQSNPDAGEPMYQVFCLMNTPPETSEEQERCLASHTCCWRITEAAKRARQHATAASSASAATSDSKRRRPAS
jgi:hypothetical protein